MAHPFLHLSSCRYQYVANNCQSISKGTSSMAISIIDHRRTRKSVIGHTPKVNVTIGRSINVSAGRAITQRMTQLWTTTLHFVRLKSACTFIFIYLFLSGYALCRPYYVRPSSSAQTPPPPPPPPPPHTHTYDISDATVFNSAKHHCLTTFITYRQ